MKITAVSFQYYGFGKYEIKSWDELTGERNQKDKIKIYPGVGLFQVLFETGTPLKEVYTAIRTEFKEDVDSQIEDLKLAQIQFDKFMDDLERTKPA